VDGDGRPVELFRSKILPLTFADFPADQWIHIRTANPIESTFATVRLRHRKTKGSGSRRACLAMVFKLLECALKTWRALNGSALIPDVIAGVQFVDGVRKTPLEVLHPQDSEISSLLIAGRLRRAESSRGLQSAGDRLG